MKRNVVLLFLEVLIPIFLLSCDENKDKMPPTSATDDMDVETSTSHPECHSSAECDAEDATKGLICISQKCLPCEDTGQCISDSYYGAAFACDNGRCLETHDTDTCNDNMGEEGCSCFPNGTCFEGLTCDEGTCIEPEPLDTLTEDTESSDTDTSDTETSITDTQIEDTETADTETSIEDTQTEDTQTEDTESSITEDTETEDTDTEPVDDCEGKEGTIHCPCDDGFCNEDMYCDGDGICRLCIDAPNSEIDCPCKDKLCDNGLVCDVITDLCRLPLSCDAMDCVENQLCEPDIPGHDAICLDDCKLGYTWNGLSCDPNDDCSCLPGEIGSILQGCTKLCRSCLDNGTACECGDCLPECTEDNKLCRPVLTCEDIHCELHSRYCESAEISPDAICGDCLPGFTLDQTDSTCQPNPVCDSCAYGHPCGVKEACDDDFRECELEDGLARCGECKSGYVFNSITGTCDPLQTCNDLDCNILKMYCLGEPNAHCEGCLPWFVPDPTQDGCRPVVTCEDLSCPVCRPEAEDADAACIDNPCKDDEAWDTYNDKCVPCPPCSGAGETGAHSPVASYQGRCICETESGYFYSEAGTIGTLPCDEDQDGWLRYDAKQALDSEDPVILQNARCHLRIVDQFVLESVDGEQYLRPIDLSEDFELYEPIALDSDSLVIQNPFQFPSYGSDGRQLRADELNTLTKACVHSAADFNDNRIADASEEHQLKIPASDLPDVFKKFIPYAYFVELYRGWYVAPSQGIKGKYVIREKSRLSDASVDDRVPIVYPETTYIEYGEAKPALYWQECSVWRDSAFSNAGQVPIGMDFAHFFSDQEPSAGLNHHSQFKCIILTDQEEADLNLLKEPTKLNARLIVDGKYNLNRCNVASGDSSSSAPIQHAINPRDPQVSCEVVDVAQVEVGSAIWSAIGYLDYADMLTSILDPLYESTYIRGCINECRRPGDPGQPELCPYTDGDPSACDCPDFDGVRSVCDANTDNYGKLLCGCHKNFGNYYGVECGRGCPDDHLMTSDNFNIATRDGYWMCGTLAASEATILEDSTSGYKIIGSVPFVAIDRTEMSGGGYTIK